MNILAELFIVFFKLGAFTIGGGVAMLPLLQNTLIDEKKWFTEEEFVDIVAVTQSLPGVIAVNMATYVGYKKRGFLGSLVSTFAVTIPSFVMILIIAKGITALEDNRIAMGAMAALRATALGLIAVAVIRLAPAAIKNAWAALSAAASFIMIVVFNVNTAWVILLFLMLGIASAMVGGRKARDEAAASDATGDGSLSCPGDEEGVAATEGRPLDVTGSGSLSRPGDEEGVAATEGHPLDVTGDGSLPCPENEEGGDGK